MQECVNGFSTETQANIFIQSGKSQSSHVRPFYCLSLPLCLHFFLKYFHLFLPPPPPPLSRLWEGKQFTSAHWPLPVQYFSPYRGTAQGREWLAWGKRTQGDRFQHVALLRGGSTCWRHTPRRTSSLIFTAQPLPIDGMRLMCVCAMCARVHDFFF